MRTDTHAHSCVLCGVAWVGNAIPEERYKEVLQHFPPSAFEITDAEVERAARVIAEMLYVPWDKMHDGANRKRMLDVARAALAAARGGE